MINLSVTQLNTYIKSVLDNNEQLKNVYVTGEISNLSIHYKSGHIYLSLKDDKSLVKAVMFSFSAKKLKFRPCDGMKVIARGKISVYEASGQYQFYIEDMQPDGLGSLNLAYEQLWEKLNKEGLFSANNKKPLPMYPRKIAVITSPNGAAVRDIISILGRRWQLADIILYPCTVQGENAVPELLNALEQAEESDCDTVIIGRGGGSLEDLWAFNDEGLARKIFSMKKPIISAVGHENDFTICDFVADVRASTPSAAAELAVPFFEEELMKIKSLEIKINSQMSNKLRTYNIMLDNYSNIDKRFETMISKKKENFLNIRKNMEIHSKYFLQKSENNLKSQIAVLESLSPLKVLLRGYGIISKNGDVVSSVKDLEKDDLVTATLTDGEVNLKVL